MTYRVIRDETERAQSIAEHQAYLNDPRKRLYAALPKRSLKGGFIYLLQRESDGAIKVGITQNLAKRVSQIISNGGALVKPIAWADTEHFEFAETQIKNAYQSQNTIGEWFNLSDGQIDLIAAYIRQLEGTQS